MIRDSVKHHKCLIYFTLCLTLICWIFLFAQLIRSHLPAVSHRAIPAFQSVEMSQFKYPPDSKTIVQMLRGYDSDIRLVSCHREKNYTDLYFYSPLIQRADEKKYSGDFNLQVAITKKHVYFGTPMLHYDF